MNLDARNRNDHDIEQLLDDALSQYAGVEPRRGLEGRLLARLSTARERPQRSLQWWGVFAFGTAAALALASFFSGLLDRGTVPDLPVAKISVPAQFGASTRGDESTANPTLREKGQKHREQLNRAQARLEHMARDKFSSAAWADVGPKLEQFPAPVPLSDQERMLALYLRDFPEKAALMARAQTELRKEDEREMAAPWPRNAAEGLEQQE